MIFGENLSADEVPVKCPCGINATVNVLDEHGRSHGWFCRTHAHRARTELQKLEKLAKAIVKKGGMR